MAKGYYVVRFKRGGWNTSHPEGELPDMYLSVDSNGCMKPVNSKAAATKFDHRGVAKCMSDHFWETSWKSYEERLALSTREFLFVKARKRKELPCSSQSQS